MDTVSSKTYLLREQLVPGNIYVGESPHTSDFIILYTGDLSRCTFVHSDQIYRNQACCTAKYVKFRLPTKDESYLLRKAVQLKKSKKIIRAEDVGKTEAVVNTYSVF